MSERGPGRPTVYTEEIADEILSRLADGETLRSICSDEHMPAIATVSQWHIDDRPPGFSERYTHARQIQAHVIFDETLEIADDRSRDIVVTEDGVSTVDHELVARSRLRVDTRKWYLSKVLPKVYGDKVQLTGDGGGPIEHRDVSELTDEELKRRTAELLAGEADG